MAMEAMDILATWSAIETRREDLIIRTVVGTIMRKTGQDELHLSAAEMADGLDGYTIAVEQAPDGNGLVYRLTRK